MKKLPTAFEIQLSIPEAGMDISYAQAKAYWTGPFLWDDYWVNALGTWAGLQPECWRRDLRQQMAAAAREA
jgi:hypothetical protein